MRKLCFALVFVLLLGCSQANNPQFIEKNNRAFQNRQELIADDTPMGKLYRVRIYDLNHWVYYFDRSTNTVTVNFRSGKINQVIVIDGQQYKLVPNQ
jgi:hypothetical protein